MHLQLTQKTVDRRIIKTILPILKDACFMDYIINNTETTIL